MQNGLQSIAGCIIHVLILWLHGPSTDILVTSCIFLLQVEASERVKASDSDLGQSDEKALVQEELSKIMLNPNVFTDFKLAGSQEVGTVSFFRF